MIHEDPIIFPGLGGLNISPPSGFKIPGTDFTIYFYGVIIALGLILAVVYGLKRSRQFGIKQDDILDGVLWIVPFAIICTRAYYVLAKIEYYDSFWDEEAQAPYLFDGSRFISYEDPRSVESKGAFVSERGLMGLVLWEYGKDDGDLVKALYEGLR